MYHLFEMHDSDGNDNSITDVIVIAEDKDAAWKLIDANVESPYEDSGDGDDDLAIYQYWKYYDEDDNETDDPPEDSEGICYSSSFYFQSSHATYAEAEAECKTYHGGPIVLGEETAEEELAHAQ